MVNLISPSAFWSMFRDDIIKRDLGWIRSVNPNGHTLESWMRGTGYKGKIDRTLLKDVEDQNAFHLNLDVVNKL